MSRKIAQKLTESCPNVAWKLPKSGFRIASNWLQSGGHPKVASKWLQNTAGNKKGGGRFAPAPFFVVCYILKPFWSHFWMPATLTPVWSNSETTFGQLSGNIRATFCQLLGNFRTTVRLISKYAHELEMRRWQLSPKNKPGHELETSAV